MKKSDKFEEEKIPFFKANECPNNMARWLQKNQVKRDNEIFEKMHSIHMDIIDILHGRSIDRMYIRLLGFGFIAVLALAVIAITNG
jgi:hypothetical protein